MTCRPLKKQALRLFKASRHDEAASYPWTTESSDTPLRKPHDGIPEYVWTVHGNETLHDYRTRTVRSWKRNLCTKISQVKTLPEKTRTDDSEDTDNEMRNCSRWTVSSMRNLRFHGRKKNGMEVLYFEVKTLLWQDCLASPFVSVQIFTGLPYMDKSRMQWPWGRRFVYLL